LVDEGYSVRCLARAASDTSRLEALDVQIAVGDLTRPDSLARAAEGCDHVLHCGAIVSDWATIAEIRSANVHGTRNVLDACAAASVQRLVHISSTDVYGHPGHEGIDEAYAATRFHNWYAQTKLESEAEVRGSEALHGMDGLETVILRPATVYGPGSIDVVGEIARAIKGRQMLLINRGRAVAGLCYVDNLLDAAVLALRHPAAPGETFNVTDGLDVTWKQFADALAAGLDAPPPRWSMPYWLANSIGLSLEHGYRLARRATGVSTTPLLSRQAVGVLGRSQDFSNRKLRELLGWRPRVDYASGMHETLEWLRNDYLRAA
jgi:nucleoside-diphosphate-sugar epimerase